MDVINFLEKSYTAYHAVTHAEYILEKHGFSKLSLADAWQLKVGGKYYVVKNGTSVIAFAVGENFAFNIAASQLKHFWAVKTNKDSLLDILLDIFKPDSVIIF